MSAEDAFMTEERKAEYARLFSSPGIAYSEAWVAYHEAEDRFYLVSKDCTVALPTPPELHGHFADLIAAPDDRLHCHPGFVSWPPGDNGEVEPFYGAANAPRPDQA